MKLPDSDAWLRDLSNVLNMHREKTSAESEYIARSDQAIPLSNAYQFLRLALHSQLLTSNLRALSEWNKDNPTATAEDPGFPQESFDCVDSFKRWYRFKFLRGHGEIAINILSEIILDILNSRFSSVSDAILKTHLLKITNPRTPSEKNFIFIDDRGKTI